MDGSSSSVAALACCFLSGLHFAAENRGDDEDSAAQQHQGASADLKVMISHPSQRPNASAM
jgi:hypothetical protein